ncbi:MAG TPA: hypothetical protein VGW33_03855 [Terriglobia bacterium]|nr:hypothetical protein [Terriglobia bacterium]
MRKSMRSIGVTAGSLLLCLGLFGVAAFGQDAAGGITQLAELTASDGAPFNLLGFSIAISGDTVVVGAPATGTGGAVYVFVKPAIGWANMTQTAKLTPSDGHGDALGTSVAISGNTVVAGAPNAVGGGQSGRGAVYVFVEPAGGWVDMTETAQLSSSNRNDFGVGTSVGLSGSTAVAGAPLADKAYVFLEPKTGWATRPQTATLTSTDPGGSFGNSVSVSGDTVAVGAPLFPAAYVFVRPATGWVNMTQTAKLTGTARQTGDLGGSVAISGGTVVTGASSASFGGIGAGAAYVFVRPTTGWVNMTPTATLTAADADQLDALGVSVAIGGNGVTVGAPGWPSGTAKGAAYVFVKPPGGWVSVAGKNRIEAFGEQTENQFGYSVAMSDGIVVSGATSFTAGGGAAFVFGNPE